MAPTIGILRIDDLATKDGANSAMIKAASIQLTWLQTITHEASSAGSRFFPFVEIHQKPNINKFPRIQTQMLNLNTLS